MHTESIVRRRSAITRHRAKLACALLLVCVIPNISLGYSVLTHEAIIDSMWVRDIVPVLLKKFPSASLEDLREAHGYAYGGAIIQDMGYYPFGSRFYSDLTHYARSGEFVEALLNDAKDVNEYAFAVGALSHYCADNDGHTIATNVVVPMLYPKLRKKYGATIAFEKQPSAHVQTEFGFDVLQLAQGHYAPQAYHDFIGFKVAKPLLERAFVETYGIELSSIFSDLDLALGSYRHSISRLLPMLTRVAWQSAKSGMARTGVAQKAVVTQDSVALDTPAPATTGTRDKFLFNLSRAEYSKEWGDKYQEPGVFAKIVSFLFRLVPKIGPLKGFAIKRSTPETELLFMRGFNATTEMYRKDLAFVRAGTLHLENRDLDTGKPTLRREYGLADQTYTRMLRSAAASKFTNASPRLRADITAFFRDTTMRNGTRKDSVAWRQTLADLTQMRETPTATAKPPRER